MSRAVEHEKGGTAQQAAAKAVGWGKQQGESLREGVRKAERHGDRGREGGMHR